MAVKEFNMNKIKRTFWPFTLKDKKDENGNAVSYTHLTLPTKLEV